MKNIKSTVHYTVPNWNFCNSDNLSAAGEMTTQLCRFCIKTRAGYRCLLYDESLCVKDELIYKGRSCCKATAGFESVIDATAAPEAPAISPKMLMKQTIELYTKTTNDLINQGYPRSMAELAAKKYLLDSQ